MIENFNYEINIDIYIDDNQEDECILSGINRKNNNEYMIMNSKTAENIYSNIIVSERKRKIEKLKDLK